MSRGTQDLTERAIKSKGKKKNYNLQKTRGTDGKTQVIGTLEVEKGGGRTIPVEREDRKTKKRKKNREGAKKNLCNFIGKRRKEQT